MLYQRISFLFFLATAVCGCYSDISVAPSPDFQEWYDRAGITAPHNLRDLVWDASGNIWIASETGIFRFDLKFQWIRYDSTNTDGVLSSNDIRSIAVDRNGVKWIGTARDGIVRFDDAHWTAIKFDSLDGIPQRAVTTILAARDGSLWCGLDSAGLLRYNATDGTGWNLFTLENTDGDLPSNVIFDMVEDRNGDLLAGTDAGIGRFGESGWSHVRFDSNAVGTWLNLAFTSLGIDSTGHLWAGNSHGVALEYDGVRWKRYDTSNTAGTLPDLPITSIAVDHSNNIWFGLTYTAYRQASNFQGANGAVRFDGSSKWEWYNAQTTGSFGGDIRYRRWQR